MIGRAVLLCGSRWSTSSQMALLGEIRHAQAEEQRTVIVLDAADGDGSSKWQRDAADALID